MEHDSQNTTLNIDPAHFGPSRSSPVFDDTLTRYVGECPILRPDILDSIYRQPETIDGQGPYDIEIVVDVVDREHSIESPWTGGPTAARPVGHTFDDNISVTATVGTGMLSTSQLGFERHPSLQAIPEAGPRQAASSRTKSRHDPACGPKDGAGNLAANVSESCLPRAQAEIQTLQTEMAMCQERIAVLESELVELRQTMRCRDASLEFLKQLTEDNRRRLCLLAAKDPASDLPLLTPDIQLDADDIRMTDRDSINGNKTET